MKISILAGTYVGGSDVRVAYPVNMVPIPNQGRAAEGYLRPAPGITSFATGTGFDRGSIIWKGVHYRVSGTSLVSISSSGVVTSLGTIGGTGPVKMDYSFDLLGIAANGLLYFWDLAVVTHVTDPNIGTVTDMIWVDGYWMVTDGTNIAVSNLGAPTVFNPLKYASTDQPDTVQCVLKALDEPIAVSRYQMDLFQNVGGAFFPFQKVPSALISKGCVGLRAACVFQDSVAFVGGGRNESSSVYLGKNAQVVKISSVEIDRLLASYTDTQLAAIFIESVIDEGSASLYLRLPDRTAVYDAPASVIAEQPVWYFLTSAITGFSAYRAANFTRVNNTWVVGDPASTAIGVLTETDSKHFGVDVRWEFSTQMLRNGGKGALVKELQLNAVTGTAPVGAGTEPMVSTAYSVDGKNWSQDRAIKSGKYGDSTKRLLWLQQGPIRNWRVQRFRGDSSSRLSALGLDAEIEALAY